MKMTARLLRLAAALALAAPMIACSGAPNTEQGEHAEAEYERGPHNGRMLRDGDFAVEITIFETGVEPQFRVYAYQGDRPLTPNAVQLSMSLTRLGGEVDRFAFAPEADFLKGDGVVEEPHSFDGRERHCGSDQAVDLRRADHHACLCADLRAHRRRRKNVPSDGVHRRLRAHRRAHSVVDVRACGSRLVRDRQG